MGRIKPQGGYRDLRGFQIAMVIYDATWWFCERYLEARSRMSDQMIQAARSCRQNIAEGSRASATSSPNELRLVNVARSSLEELLLDFEDFLRHRQIPQWAPDSPEAMEVRRIGRADHSDQSSDRNSDEIRYSLYVRWLDHAEAAIRANTIICLIHQANVQLDRQIEALERELIGEAGYSEQLAAARPAERSRKKNQADPGDQSNRTDSPPNCPKCGKPMFMRTARNGKNAGRQFWGCPGYPECKGIADV
ncbi:MAG: four helix bundle protein [Chlorobiaceae bacterium]|nr:four helix bundle protein [Chlorobiaceae bacterium]NTV60299.1 four helix bundle protein [Chlorobiaceae bacterium]